MPFGPLNPVVEALAARLRTAKAEELAAVEELRAHMQSHDLDEATLAQLTAEMVRAIEHAAVVWNELQEAMQKGRNLKKATANTAG